MSEYICPFHIYKNKDAKLYGVATSYKTGSSKQSNAIWTLVPDYPNISDAKFSRQFPNFITLFLNSTHPYLRKTHLTHSRNKPGWSRV